MIPFSFSYLWIFLIAGMGSLIFCLFAIGLIFSKQCRIKLKNGNIFLQTLFVSSCLSVILTIGLFFLVEHANRESKANHDAIYKTLAAPQTILGIAMPTGTELWLFEPNHLNSFRTATFPTPVAFGRFQISEVKIPKGIDLKLFEDRSITLYGHGTDQVEGWSCKLENHMNVYLDEKSNISGLEFCTLANSIQLKQLTLQASAKIHRSHHQQYPDGLISQDYWQIHNPLTHYKNISVEWATIYVDQNKNVLGIENGTLIEDLKLGGIAYPKGTEFNLLVHPLLKNQETWLFTPPQNQTAKAENGTIYTDQQAILHTTKGHILQVFNTSDEKIMARRNNS